VPGDIRSYLGDGGGRQRDGGDVREVLFQPGELPVFGPEGVAPCGDAVRLVDGDEPDREPAERFQEVGLHALLRREEEQPEGVVLQLPLDLLPLP